MAEEKQCGLVTMTTPVELRIMHGKCILQLTGRHETLMWDDDYLNSKELKTLVNFVEFVYKTGFADGSIAAMNIDKPQLKMFAIVPREFGYDSFFVMCDTKENAIEAVLKLKDTERGCDYLKNKDMYTINEHLINDVVWHENA